MDEAAKSETATIVKLFYAKDEATARQHINFIGIDKHTAIAETSPVYPSQREEDLAFAIVNNARTYYLVAPSAELKTTWLRTLRRIKRLLLIQLQARRLRDLSDQGQAPVVALPSKLERMLASEMGRESASSPPDSPSQQRHAHVRASIDVLIERATGLGGELAGKHCCVRVAYVNPSTSLFVWWEYWGSPASRVSATGECEWNSDFSFESGLVGSFLIVRVVEVRTNSVVSEMRMDPMMLLHAASADMQESFSFASAFPLSSPVWEEDDVLRSGGTLLPDDVERQGGKRDASDRGQLWLRFGWARREDAGMLCRLGRVAHPVALRCNTGDVLLFNQSTTPARLTKLFTWSKWSHAAVVVRMADDSLHVLEATGAGVALYTFESVWRRYHRTTHVAVCRLLVPNGLTPGDHESLYAFIEKMRGRPYERSIFSLVGKVARGARSPSTGSADDPQQPIMRRSPTDVPVPRNYSPALQTRTRRSRSATDMTEVFCSELVAGAFRALGVLAPDAVLELLPKHFDSTESGRMALERGAQLLPPRVFLKNELAEY